MQALRSRLMPLLAMLFLVASCAHAPVPPGTSRRSDALFAQVKAGMSPAEVTTLLGPPDETMRFRASDTEAWDYRYEDTWGFPAIFSVTYGPGGRVASTVSNRIGYGGGARGR